MSSFFREKLTRFVRTVLPAIGLLLAHSAVFGADWKVEREQLDRMHAAGRFRIFYALAGANALSEQSRVDLDGNGIPDLVERVAAKLVDAQRVYTETLGFADPLTSPRFKDKVRFIDVHFVLLGGQGNAGDGVHEFDYRADPNNDGGALVITLSSSLKPESLTPEHELFHIVQYGHTSIKNGWLSEGTARWSERVFAGDKREAQVLPANARELDDLLNKSYGAGVFWRRLAQLCDADRPADQGIVRALYASLGDVEKKASARRNLVQYEWRGREKTAPLNDRYILTALAQAADRTGCRSNREVARFLEVAEAYGGDAASQRNVTAALELVGNPFARRYPDGAEVYARSIWGMQAFAGSLFLGAGNASNAGPAPNAGPVPIIRFDPQRERFVTEGSVDDEQVSVFRVLDGQLHIPGLDARGSARMGNFYRRDDAGEWRKFRNLPHALHVFDMASHAGKLFAALGTPKGAAVAVSANKGEAWDLTYLGEKQRVFNLIKLDDTLYAVKQLLAKRNVADLPLSEQANYFAIAEYRDGEFKPRPDIKAAALFPDMPLRAERSTMLMHATQANGKLAYIGAYYINNPFGVFVAASLKPERGAIRRVYIPKAYFPAGLLARGNRLYILCNREEEDGYRSMVLETALDDPEAVRELFHFKTSTIVRSFEELDGDFYFGLGYALSSQKNWRVEDISGETGNLIRLPKEKVPRTQLIK